MEIQERMATNKREIKVITSGTQTPCQCSRSPKQSYTLKYATTIVLKKSLALFLW